MTSHLNHYIVQQRQLELTARAEQAQLASQARRGRASSPHRLLAGLLATRRLGYRLAAWLGRADGSRSPKSATERTIAPRTSGHRFTTDRAQRTSHKYGAHSVSLVALTPVRASRHTSDLSPGGGGNRIARAARDGRLDHTSMTQEISK